MTDINPHNLTWQKLRLSKAFTGIDSPYEVPEQAELTLNADLSVQEEVAREVDYLVRYQYIA